MNRLFLILLAGGLLFAQGQTKKPQSLKEVLLEQLHSTHDKKDWFVSIKEATEGLTAEQAKWTDGHGNHSGGQLGNHPAFWNARGLQQFKGEKRTTFDGNNDETFNSFDAKS